MSTEDFTNGPKQNHPEVADNPEAVRSAEQVTLHHLLGVLNGKVGEPSEYDGKRRAELRRAGQSTSASAATVFIMDKGSDSTYPDAIGQIHRQERVGNDGGSVITNYFILDTPDGLQIDKHSQIVSLNRGMLSDSPEMVMRLSLESIARIAQMRESQAVENELGLSFVSEQETRDLIAFLDPLVVFLDPLDEY